MHVTISSSFSKKQSKGNYEMKRSLKILIVFFTLIVVTPLSAAYAQNIQMRPVLHVTNDVTKNWYSAHWAIGNWMSKSPENINVFHGAGYRTKTAWVETLLQQQVKAGKDDWFVDIRSRMQKGRLSLYAEGAPFLTRRAFYNLISVDHTFRVKEGGKTLGIGFETENIHRGGKDSIGAGPRLTMPIGAIKGWSIDVAVAYHIRPHEHNVLRLYPVINKRF